MTDQPATPDEAEQPAVRAPRASVMLSARLEHFGGGVPSTHRVRDVSTGGIRIDQAGTLRKGATVLISVGSLEAVAATVIWLEGDCAGLSFAQPIDPDEARKKAGIAPKKPGTGLKVRTSPVPVARSGGWIGDLQNPYRR